MAITLAGNVRTRRESVNRRPKQRKGDGDMRGNYQIDGYKRVHDSGRDCPHCIVKVKSHQHLTTGEIIEKCHTCGRVYRDSMNRESLLTEEQIDSRTD